jgi:benzoyl-CoA reductase/2-hydroxyglutaryl-CoA dehydratase subunit BcrC/BadD/HgdB
MNAVAYCHPFVPPEWIAAHGLRPYWLPCRAGDEPAVWVQRGACPVAAGRIDDFRDELPAEAVVLTTTCDQIRYAAALLQHQGRLPVFLLDVPRTWQSRAMRTFYGEEIGRLGRFLVGLGGTAPQDDALVETMLQYDRARALLRQRRGEMSAGGFARAIDEVRGDLRTWCETTSVGWTSESVWLQGTDSEVHLTNREAISHQVLAPVGQVANLPKPSQIGNLPQELRLALVGGPISPGDYELLTVVEDAGGRFVLDATESGERTLPAPVDIDRLQADPREELVRIYFDCIPEVFQRPNDRLFTWLRAEVAQRCVRGILVRRHVWCDHWHGEMARLREELAVPILEWDGAGNDPRAQASAVGRMEAFLEMLR